MSWQRWVLVASLILGGFLVFGVISFGGQKLLEKEEAK